MADAPTTLNDGTPVVNNQGTPQAVPNTTTGGTPTTQPTQPPEPAQNSLVQKGTIRQIVNQNYYFEVIFYNQITNEKPTAIPFFNIDSLVINETLTTWSTSGEIVISNPFEIFSKGALPSALNKEGVKAPYIDRTDGRNRVMIKIYPVDSENEADIKTQNKASIPREYYEMCYDFVVIEIEDLEVENNQVKKRKYKLIDERHQVLYERNLEWSTAIFAAKEMEQHTLVDINAETPQLKATVKPYTLTDDQASMNPNKVLLKFLEIAGNNKIGDFTSYDATAIRAQLNNSPETVVGDVVKVGYPDSGSIDKPTIPFYNYDNNNWDQGDPTNKFKHTSFAYHNGLDDLNFILAHCKGKDGTPVLLNYGRTTKDKTWKLVSLKSIFDNAEKNQVERIFIEDGLGIESSLTYIPRGPVFEKPTTYLNMTSILASRINNYMFSPMSALDDNLLMNSPMHYFDFQKKEFNVSFKNNTFSNLIEKLKSTAEKLYSFKNNKRQKPQVLLNFNKVKQKGIMTKNHTSFNGKFAPFDAPLLDMMFNAVFLNQTLCFTAIGLTLRTPGKFIFIDKVSSSTNNPFDDRFLGQWLITKVVHRFENTAYLTDVTAVKIDAFAKIFDEVDTK